MNLISVAMQGFSLFKKGSELRDSDNLKNAQLLGNLLTAAVVFVANFWEPVQQYVSPDTVNALAALIASVANTLLLPTTNANIGFGIADEPPEIESAGIHEPADADADRSAPAPKRLLRQSASAPKAAATPERTPKNVQPGHRDQPKNHHADERFPGGFGDQ